MSNECLTADADRPAGALIAPRRARAVFASACFGALLVATSQAAAQSLGSAESFAIVGGSSATAAGTGSEVAGDVGVSPGTSITGFDGTAATVVPPFITHANDGLAIAAQISVDTLYTFLATGAGPCSPLAAQLDGVTVGPGVYCFSSTADLAATGTLTLDGAGTYIFQVGSSLTANALSTVTLLNGADPCNVFWQIGSAATLNGDFAGNVVAQAGVTVGSGTSLLGRALTTAAGAVTLAGGNSVGGCSTAAGPTPTPAPTATGAPSPTAAPSPAARPTSSASVDPNGSCPTAAAPCCPMAWRPAA